LSGHTSRADLFIRMSSGRLVFVSVKDDTTPAKLGQVSAATSYGAGSLAGGLARMSIPAVPIPKVFDHRHTTLSASRFAKLGERDRQFAYIKKNHPDAWNSAVSACLDEAVEQTRIFTDLLVRDESSLLGFIKEVTAGCLADSGDFYILVGDALVHFGEFINALASADITARAERYQARNKTSYIVWLDVNGIEYGLTKIEPAFDGAKNTTEQTKGIIFYFQQHPNSGNHYKQLLVDLVE